MFKSALVLALLIAVASCMSTTSSEAELSSNPLLARLFKPTLAKLLNHPNRHQWPPSDSELEEALFFLLRFTPKQDGNLTVDFILENIGGAFDARYFFPWGPSVPWHIFLNDVLPYAVLTEPRDNWRYALLNYFKNKTELRAPGMTIAKAAVLMNTIAWQIVDPAIIFIASPPDEISSYSVFQVMGNHSSSCTGLAVFFTAALRSIGIPARAAGTPHWNNGPKACPQGDASPGCGNHDWVEVWSEGGWSFINDFYKSLWVGLNSSWFFPTPTHLQQFGVTNHSINAASWAPSRYLAETYGYAEDPMAVPRGHFPMVWEWLDWSVGAWEVTKRYLWLANHTKVTQPPV